MIALIDDLSSIDMFWCLLSQLKLSLQATAASGWPNSSCHGQGCVQVRDLPRVILSADKFQLLRGKPFDRPRALSSWNGCLKWIGLENMTLKLGR